MEDDSGAPGRCQTVGGRRDHRLPVSRAAQSRRLQRRVRRAPPARGQFREPIEDGPRTVFGTPCRTRQGAECHPRARGKFSRGPREFSLDQRQASWWVLLHQLKRRNQARHEKTEQGVHPPDVAELARVCEMTTVPGYQILAAMVGRERQMQGITLRARRHDMAGHVRRCDLDRSREITLCYQVRRTPVRKRTGM